MCGAVSDLHAADTRYHKGCRVSFMYQKSTSAAVKGHEDESLRVVINVLHEDQLQIWNLVELHTLYVENGGCVTCLADACNQTSRILW